MKKSFLPGVTHAAAALAGFAAGIYMHPAGMRPRPPEDAAPAERS